MKSISISPQEILYLNNSLASVFGHTGGYLRIEWHTVPMVSAEVRQLFDQILGLLRQEDLHCLFTERTVAPPINGDDCQWVASEWVPRATREAGLTHCAVVESREVIASRTSCLPAPAHPGTRPQLRYFDNFAQAETWIQQVA